MTEVEQAVVVSALDDKVSDPKMRVVASALVFAIRRDRFRDAFLRYLPSVRAAGGAP